MTSTATTTSAPTHGPPARSLPVLLLVVLLLDVLLALTGAGRAFGASGGPDPVGVWPLAPEPVVAARFDPPDSAYGAGHRGVDLAGRVGQPVRAALPGTVTFAGLLAGRGVVVIDHGLTRTTYEPVHATVSLGAEVVRGGPLGTLQLPGSHCFPQACLHWGWIEDQTYLDPLRLVGDGPVRLLPLWSAAPVAPAAGRLTTPTRLPLPFASRVWMLRVLPLWVALSQ